MAAAAAGALAAVEDNQGPEDTSKWDADQIASCLGAFANYTMEFGQLRKNSTRVAVEEGKKTLMYEAIQAAMQLACPDSTPKTLDQVGTRRRV
jgi:hypothetical protein